MAHVDVDVDPDEVSGAQLLALNACAQEFGMQEDDFMRCVLMPCPSLLRCSQFSVHCCTRCPVTVPVCVGAQ